MLIFQRVLLIGAAILGVHICTAWVTFALSEPPFEAVLPKGPRAKTGLRNLALFDEGIVVRTSSNERFGRHHPGYALDGHPPTMAYQKWLSATGDIVPWIEVGFTAPRKVEHVRLRFTSHLEPNARVCNVYTLTCVTAQGKQEKISIRHNTNAHPTHAFYCLDAVSMRITFPPDGRPVGEQIRIMELEVWGSD